MRGQAPSSTLEWSKNTFGSAAMIIGVPAASRQVEGRHQGTEITVFRSALSDVKISNRCTLVDR